MHLRYLMCMSRLLCEVCISSRHVYYMLDVGVLAII